MKPLLLIDVDGVLNPFAARSCPEGFEEHILMRYRVYLSRQQGEWLNSLADLFELTWCTAWMDAANEHIGPNIGLPQLPVVHFPPNWRNRYHSGSWKLPDIKEYVGDRPFAWIDDDINADAVEWARYRYQETGVNSALVLCDPAIGLTASQVDLLRDFGTPKP